MTTSTQTTAMKCKPSTTTARPTLVSPTGAAAVSPEKQQAQQQDAHKPATVQPLSVKPTVQAHVQSGARARAASTTAHHAHHVAQKLSLGSGTLKLGSKGAHVKALQQDLNKHGAHLAVDGNFGPHTEAAVKHYQATHGLSPDGVVGPQTRHALETNKKAVHGVHHTTGGDTSTVAGCAKILLHSPNVTFWGDLSSGSDRQNFQRLANGEQAHVFATNHTGPSNVTPSLRMMQALVEMSRHGSIQINALTGGTHSFNSNHYSGHAVDLSVFGLTQPDRPLGAHHLPMLSVSEIERIAAKHGGVRNFETSHAHIDF